MMLPRSFVRLALAAAVLCAAVSPAWSRPAPSSVACSAAGDWEAVEAAVRDSMAGATPGLAIAVACRGEVVFQAGYGAADLSSNAPVRSDTVFRLASVTKMMTGAVVMKLVDEGKLRLDDLLSAHLPEFPGGDHITLYQLLTHTSGLADFPEDASYPAHKARDHSTAEMVAWISTLQPLTRFPPGQGWGYSNSGYVLLGAVIERITGQDLQTAYAQRLFEPLDLHSMAFDFPRSPTVAPRAHGYRRDAGSASGFVPAEPISMTLPGPAGSLRTTAGDAARFADALFGGRLLTSESLAVMTSPGLLADGRPNRWGMPQEWREGLKADYAGGLFVDDHTGRRRYWHAGDIDGFHTWLAHFPDEGVTIVLLRNSENGDPMHERIQAAVFEALGGE